MVSNLLKITNAARHVHLIDKQTTRMESPCFSGLKIYPKLKVYDYVSDQIFVCNINTRKLASNV